VRCPVLAWDSTNRATGLAVAMSDKMSLHIDSTELLARGIMSQRMKDMRSMAFWGIFVLDR
jgi:hypothetical protein